MFSWVVKISWRILAASRVSSRETGDDEWTEIIIVCLERCRGNYSRVAMDEGV